MHDFMHRRLTMLHAAARGNTSRASSPGSSPQVHRSIQFRPPSNRSAAALASLASRCTERVERLKMNEN
jgi:hypothetical protein